MPPAQIGPWNAGALVACIELKDMMTNAAGHAMRLTQVEPRL
jgi:hypothetical protein